ncbi:MAG: L,D-transpeptidase [Alphaproteobacteria bacterium]|nr:L,D-transpeptidase [Alphaproteobacteria bacterium]
MNRLAGISAAVALAVLTTGIAAPESAHAQFWSSNPSGSSVYDKYTVDFSKKYEPGQIIVSFGDRKLYHVVARGRAVSYPIAVPRPESRWSGTLRVTQKRVNPTWTPTPTMRRENPKLPSFVEGGDPRNPLGVRALYLGSTLYRIHGTDAPWTIGQNVSKGCIRMHNEHVLELYERVKVGAKVVATWERFGAQAVTSSGGGAGTTSNFMKSILGDNT